MGWAFCYRWAYLTWPLHSCCSCLGVYDLIDRCLRPLRREENDHCLDITAAFHLHVHVPLAQGPAPPILKMYCAGRYAKLGKWWSEDGPRRWQEVKCFIRPYWQHPIELNARKMQALEDPRHKAGTMPCPSQQVLLHDVGGSALC